MSQLLFSVPVIKFPGTNKDGRDHFDSVTKVKKEKLIFGSQFEDAVHHCREKSRQQVLEAVHHVVFTVRKQRRMNASIQQTFSFLCS